MRISFQQMIENADRFNLDTRCVSNEITKEQADQISKLRARDFKHVNISFELGATKFEVIQANNAIVCPRRTAPSLRFLQCRGTDPQKRLLNKAGPAVALFMSQNYNCQFTSDKFQFGAFNSVSIDHLISYKKLILAVLAGIIDKCHLNSKVNLHLTRRGLNSKKGETSFYKKTKKRIDTYTSKEEAKDLIRSIQSAELLGKELSKNKLELDKFLRSSTGQFLLSLKKESGAYKSQLVHAALFYYGQLFISCKEKSTSFIKNEFALFRTEKGSFDIGSFILWLLKKHNSELVGNSF